MTLPGYNCSRCGAWVYEAQTHVCYMPLESPKPEVITREDINTIIRLLKEIEYLLRTRRG